MAKKKSTSTGSKAEKDAPAKPKRAKEEPEVKPDEATDGEAATEETEAEGEVAYNLDDFNDLLSLMRDQSDDSVVKKHIASHIRELADRHDLDGYNILFLFDEHDQISRGHSNWIYEAARGTKDQDILLVINSRGGRIEPAYLISKTCKKLANEKFAVAIPRRAKSAATLIALGADELHMGLLSELGPIDPQIGNYPALALGNALTVLAKLADEYPDASLMFAQYLSNKLDMESLGYFERISESAAQYAERLLEGSPLPSGHTPASLAQHFVNHYKDHSFVIDVDETSSLMGDAMVKRRTNEYFFSNEVHQFLMICGLFSRFERKQDFTYVGSIRSGLRFREAS